MKKILLLLIERDITVNLMTTFYKRVLPDKLISFSSREGKDLFKSALMQGGMENYFKLAEQFTTQ